MGQRLKRRPLAIDPNAVSASSTEPAFIAKPPAAPAYHGFPLLDDVIVEGYRSLVQSATLTLRYDIATNRPLPSAPQFIESPFTCDVRITDVRGKNYLAHFDGWWYPERLERPQSESSAWWKFWAARGGTN